MSERLFRDTPRRFEQNGRPPYDQVARGERTVMTTRRTVVTQLLLLVEGFGIGAWVVSGQRWGAWVTLVALLAWIVTISGAPGPDDPR